ncbi:MAG: ribosome assembly factor SBDS [Candidatus Nanohaloarchaea archaeon]
MDTSDAVRVRYDEGKQFEILVEPDLAKEAKLEDEDHEIQRLLFVQEVFLDADSGERASTGDLEEEFGTSQIMEAAREIFDKGDMQLTTDQKAEMREDKYRQVVDMIARRAQDPKTGNPHPPERVENALEEAGFNAEPFEDVESQFDRAIDGIRPIIPVSLDEKTVAIRIPVDSSGRAYDRIQQKADVKEEQWGDEYFTCKLKMPAGALTELMEELQEMTSGKAEMQEI